MELTGRGRLWIRFNMVLFSLYVLFGVASRVWPSAIDNVWLLLPHTATLMVNAFIVYSLKKGVLRSNYLVAAVSAVMAAHLVVFILIPLTMAVAYVGPSRSFYSLFILLLHQTGADAYLNSSFTLFNSSMLLVHTANVYFFTRTRVAV